MPMEPGARVVIELPCEARLELKLWRLIAPAKPLPMERPVTSTFCPGWNIVTDSS